MTRTVPSNYNPFDNSSHNILAFLEMAGENKIIGAMTAKSRKASVSKILVYGDVLEHAEHADVGLINVEETIRKIRELYAVTYSPNSLETHCSHVRCAINDFIEYNNDPDKYPPGSYIPRHRKIKINRGGKVPRQPLAQPQPRSSNSTFSIPIPIKGGKQIVMIDGLPNDFSKEDADKISAVMLALATGQSASA